MDIKEIRKQARNNMKGFCNVCPVCNGVYCAGEVPGMGGTGTGESFKANVEDLKKIKLRLKTIHDAKDPDTSFNFFGEKLSMPIIVAPITGTEFNMGGALTEEEYIDSVVKGSLNSGTIAMVGDSAYPELYQTGVSSIAKYSGKGVGIIKPKENEKVIQAIEFAEEKGLLACGMDIDGAGLITMALKGAPVGPKTTAELKEIIDSTDLPFILKGIMTVEEALLAVELGVDAIVVSNHGGRVLDHAESSASVLPAIKEAVGNKLMVLVDGGIRSGIDVFKMLALGADAVLVGRPIVTGAFGGYDEGVSLVLDTMKEELYKTMILTGAKSLKSIDGTMIV